MKIIRLYTLFFALFALGLLATCKSNKKPQNPPPTTQTAYLSEIAGRADSLLNYLHTKRNFNGNILIHHNGLKILEKSYGYADFRDKTPLKVQSSFRLSSVSKQFTAMAIMMLKEAGKLSYGDTVAHFLRGFPYPNITIRQLLNHTSGLPNYGEYFAKVVLRSKYKFTYPTNNDILLWLINERPKPYFKAGESWLYTNTGYVLLALIIERVSRQSYPAYLKQSIFDRLGMHQSEVFDYQHQLPYRVYGFKNNKKLYDDHLFNRIYGDAGVYASTTDLYKWDQALRTNRLVSKATLEEAFAPTKYYQNMFSKNYGFGWHIDKDGQTVYHSGSSGGFRSIILRNLHQNSCVILLSNNQDGRYENIARTIYGWLD